LKIHRNQLKICKQGKKNRKKGKKTKIFHQSEDSLIIFIAVYRLRSNSVVKKRENESNHNERLGINVLRDAI